MKRFTSAILALTLACEGSGSGGDGFLVANRPIAANCTPLVAPFPPGLSIGSDGRAFAVQDAPTGIQSFTLDEEAPTLEATILVGIDSDMEGTLDTDQNVLGAVPPFAGELSLTEDGLGLLSTSNFEQVLVFDLNTNAPLLFEMETPASFAANAFPMLPLPGEVEIRAGISTLTCVIPPAPTFSDGTLVSPDCDPGSPSFYSQFTAGKARAGDHLFVATSNLDRFNDRFFPGTVLVYDWDDSGSSLRVQPNETTPVLFTTAFNPTGVTPYTTPNGRELLLVTATGDIGIGTGAGNNRTGAAIDVIDPVDLRIVASIPLGLAGPSFDPVAIDASGTLGLLGAITQRQLYAIDLRPLENPALYLGGAPIVLDGSTPGFPDARVFDGANPFPLPDRTDGPPEALCDGFTFATFNAAGDTAFATDWCDGTLTSIGVDVAGSPPIPLPASRLRVLAFDSPFAPRLALGQLVAPTRPRVRPGEPGVDYAGPDVFVLISEPGGQLCGLRVESPEPVSP